MPKRSNEFQRLIETIHHQLGSGATVSESCLLEDRVTHQLREVDIVIETTVAESSIRIGIECCDLSRRASVEWVERMCGKHSHLPVDKLLLVSRSGFTRTAFAKAAIFGADALTFADAERVPWTSALKGLDKVYLDAIDVRTFIFADVEASPRNIDSTLSHDTVVLTSDGRGQTRLGQVVDALLQVGPVRERVLDSVPQDSDAGSTIEFKVARGTRILEAGDRQREISVLRFVVLLKRRWHPLALKAGMFREFHVAFAESESDLGTVTLAVIEREGQAPTALLVRRRNGLKEIVPVTGARTREFDAAPDDIMRALFGTAV